MKITGMNIWILSGIFFAALAAGKPASAHCDTLSGPVATEAMGALQTGKVDAVLKWVRKEDEEEVERAFRAAMKTRKLGPDAQKVADLYFIETLVRLHRASEGEPFTGLKPAGTPLEPGIRESDEALEEGSADGLVKDLDEKITRAVREKFLHALEAKRHAGESVAKGREYVAAYVDFVHTVEHLNALLEGGSEHARQGEEAK